MAIKKIGKIDLKERDYNGAYASRYIHCEGLCYYVVESLWRKMESNMPLVKGEQEEIKRNLKIKELFIKQAEEKPIPLKMLAKDDYYYLYKSFIYKASSRRYSDEQLILMIMEIEDKERQKFERLKHKFTLAQEEEHKPKRQPIPESVRIAVWRRDEGKCSKCGSRVKLEYDHIVPVSQGGANTVRNIELLCEACNRSKGANIQ